MDSREKIVSGRECRSRLAALKAAKSGLRLVSGYFDPLLAWHAERIEEARGEAGALAVTILEPPDPILPARARAELVAALRAVDLVLIPQAEALEFPSIRLDEADLAVRGRFIERVRERQS